MTSNQRVALVTGSRKGIGRYLVERLLGAGFSVLGCSRSEAQPIPGAEILRADVGQEADVQRIFTHVRQRFGKLDVLINNAGVASMNHALLTPASAVEEIMRTNFLGTFMVSREAAKLMMKGREGRIVNVSTIAVPFALEGEAAYAASKGAVETLTRVLAHELGPYGITVNAVGPAPIATDLIRGVPSEKIDRIVERLAIKRLGTPEDVFQVVDFLIHPKSGFVTGQVIYLGGP